MQKSISKTRFESLVKRRLADILANRTEGAGKIEDATFELLAFMLRSGMSTPEVVLSSVEAVRDRFPLMANITSLAVFVSRNVRRHGLDSLPKQLKEYNDEITINRHETIDKASKNILEFETVFTLSNSSSARQAMIKAKAAGWEGSVLIAESRPKNEGAILARQLAEEGIKVVLTVDSSMPELIERAEAIFLGSDCVTPTFFINKIGSTIAVELAKRWRRPIYVIADKAKVISDRDFRFMPDDNPASEILKSENPNLTIINHYFEKVKPTGDLRYISGKRVYSPGEIKSIIRST